jgi:hypothetical protein
MKQFLIGLSVCYLVSAPSVWAVGEPGAYIERISFTQARDFTWYLPPRAELTVLDQSETVITSAMDSGREILITAINAPEVNAAQYQVFYSDGTGISSRILLDFSQSTMPVLMPPTIYSMPNINGQNGALGFVGSAFPSSTVNLEITLSTNEKLDYKTLANVNGEWQIMPPKLPQGRHQAKAFAQFQEVRSEYSQLVSITILAPTDQFIQDLGEGTRQSIDSVVNVLPSPVKKAVQEIDKSSDISSKYIFPTLLTISTLAQSGLLFQNIVYFLYQALLGLGQLLGLIKKRQPLGLVYDAITKLPLGRVIVRIYRSQDHHLIETDVTTLGGVFSFMPVEGYYYIRAFKPGYIFPSQIVLSRRDGKYSPVYIGGEIHVTADSATVNVVVPMDPEAYQETWLMKFTHIWQRWVEPMNKWLLLLGFFLSLLSYSRQPTRVNFIIFCLYIAGIYYSWIQGRKSKREFGLVVNSLGKPLAGVELILTDTEFNRLVSRRVTDEKGRYQFVAPAGKYQIRMVTPQYELVTKVHGAYQGEELKVEGERGTSKHIFPRIVVRNTVRK